MQLNKTTEHFSFMGHEYIRMELYQWNKKGKNLPSVITWIRPYLSADPITDKEFTRQLELYIEEARWRTTK